MPDLMNRVLTSWRNGRSSGWRRWPRPWRFRSWTSCWRQQRIEKRRSDEENRPRVTRSRSNKLKENKNLDLPKLFFRCDETKGIGRFPDPERGSDSLLSLKWKSRLRSSLQREFGYRGRTMIFLDQALFDGYWFLTQELSLLRTKISQQGGLHSTEVAYLLLTQLPQVGWDIPKKFSLDVTVIHWQHCLEQWAEAW